ncbi:unnamed protein product [Oikopleura dioica]|uniref:Uncharacterized protein n=1 Tax=Oikopleura dioica TaxID=34765 RepID=E4YV36_OIKDI|nr:unnamed protein product [Oikopleura dioica]
MISSRLSREKSESFFTQGSIEPPFAGEAKCNSKEENDKEHKISHSHSNQHTIIDMFGWYTDNFPDNLDRRSWIETCNHRGKYIYNNRSHSREKVKRLLETIKLVPTIVRFNVKVEACTVIQTEAGDYSIDVRSNYPWLPTVWSFSMQRLDSKPFKFKAQFVSYSDEDIRDYEQSREVLVSKNDKGRETVSFSSWAAYHVGRWDVELIL